MWLARVHALVAWLRRRLPRRGVARYPARGDPRVAFIPRTPALFAPTLRPSSSSHRASHDTSTLVENSNSNRDAPDLVQPRIVSRLRATRILNSLGRSHNGTTPNMVLGLSLRIRAVMCKDKQRKGAAAPCLSAQLVESEDAPFRPLACLSSGSHSTQNEPTSSNLKLLHL
jgi:hypothetical protein